MDRRDPHTVAAPDRSGAMIPGMNRLTRALSTALAVLLLAMICLSTWNVVARYLFNRAILWADEIAVFGLLAITWLGVIVVVWRGSDIRMDILVRLAPRRLQVPAETLQDLLVAGTCGWVAWLSVGYVQRVHRIGMTSDTAQVPVWFLHALVPLSLSAIALIALVRLARRLVKGVPS
jgi:TRAP-type C4-dicarboxylate transport system permease small subunit